MAYVSPAVYLTTLSQLATRVNPLYTAQMANITLTVQTNSPIRIDTTHFGVGVATIAELTGTDLQIAEIYRDAGLGVMSEGTPPDFETLPTIEEADGDLIVSFVVSGDPAPSIEYTWFTSETEEGTYTEVPGATTDTLTSPAEGWYKASIKATNTYGTVTDESVPLQVLAPDFTVQPSIEEADGDLVVSFVVSGNPTPSIEYTWLTSETEEGTYAEVPGATTDTLASPSPGWYKASIKATNVYGTVTDESVPFEVEA